MYSHTHNYQDGNGDYKSLDLAELPSECPRCLKHVQLRSVATKADHNPYAGEYTAQIVYDCPVCDGFFIAEYFTDELHDGSSLVLKRVVPQEFSAKTYSPEVEQASPDFIRLVKQAEQAAFYELTDIAGPAYRKALEFLIKDYAIAKNPADAAAIKTKQLGPVIQTYVNDPKVKTCAERATWLGNDETHYVRFQSNFNLKDMVILIDLTVHWIEAEHLTDQYETNIQPVSRRPQAP